MAKYTYKELYQIEQDMLPLGLKDCPECGGEGRRPSSENASINARYGKVIFCRCGGTGRLIDNAHQLLVYGYRLKFETGSTAARWIKAEPRATKEQEEQWRERWLDTP